MKMRSPARRTPYRCSCRGFGRRCAKLCRRRAVARTPAPGRRRPTASSVPPPQGEVEEGLVRRLRRPCAAAAWRCASSAAPCERQLRGAQRRPAAASSWRRRRRCAAARRSGRRPSRCARRRRRSAVRLTCTGTCACVQRLAVVVAVQHDAALAGHDAGAARRAPRPAAPHAAPAAWPAAGRCSTAGSAGCAGRRRGAPQPAQAAPASSARRFTACLSLASSSGLKKLRSQRRQHLHLHRQLVGGHVQVVGAGLQVVAAPEDVAQHGRDVRRGQRQRVVGAPEFALGVPAVEQDDLPGVLVDVVLALGRHVALAGGQRGLDLPHAVQFPAHQAPGSACSASPGRPPWPARRGCCCRGCRAPSCRPA